MGNKEKKHKSNKGEKEQYCLDMVRNACFSSFSEDLVCVTNLKNSDIYQYGFRYNAGQIPELENENEDYEPIVELLNTAINTDFNTAETNFPDFECTNGIIEHFQVSASKTTKKGYESMQKYGEADKNLNKKIEKDIQDGKLKEHYEEEVPSSNQSYENFIKSFITTWENHICKLNEYEGNKENVCFLIQSDTFGLKMELQQKHNFELGITTGKIQEHYINNKQEKFNFVLLGRCKELLEFIDKYKDKVQYVIFIASDNCIELIKTDKAKYIANILDDYECRNLYVSRYITADIY